MSLILPPRFEDRAAEDAAMMLDIPIYEADENDSLRPTWLPIDPTTFRPPPPHKSRGAKLASAGKIALLLFATWGIAFASVVGPPVARDFLTKRSAAASHGSDATASNALSSAPVSAAPATTPLLETKSADAVTLTVDVMSLPISKNFPHSLTRKGGGNGKGSRRAGS
ncbi:MAG: hypothetical protein ABI183_04825 [Polyangiaceae bacterium]